MSAGRHPTPFTKVLAFWTPRRFVSEHGIDVAGFVADINVKVGKRGFVMWDRQVLTTPLDERERIDAVFEPGSLDQPLEIPPRAMWGAEQRGYFGLHDPYQMADEGDTFTSSHIMTSLEVPYLGDEERVIGILHGETDGRPFYCGCHSATVVYTTTRQLICMSCGATHVVLRKPLGMTPTVELSADDWRDLFDHDGSRRHEEVDLPIVDFCAVETAETIWRTNQWEDACHEFIFFARTSPEEVEKAIRGTEMDPSIFMEAGWKPFHEPPPPALQLMQQGVDVDLAENAEHAFRDGVAALVAAYVHPDQLLTAVPQLARAVELLLKARLEMADADGLADKPNGPTVLRRLRDQGVRIDADGEEILTSLRRLRNDLQHGEATFSHRAGLTICRRSIVWLDQFSEDELGLWTGDAIRGDDWVALLTIEEVAERAVRIVNERMASVRDDPQATIEECPRCHRETMVRPHPSTGASCAYCGHVPVARGDEGELDEPVDLAQQIVKVQLRESD